MKKSGDGNHCTSYTSKINCQKCFFHDYLDFYVFFDSKYDSTMKLLKLQRKRENIKIKILKVSFLMYWFYGL